MKKLSLLFVVFVAILCAACKKDYNCSAIDASGTETILKCENCSKKDVTSYEESIVSAGYASASCEK